MRLFTFAAATVLVASASSGAIAQYVCPPGYGYYGGVCQPVARSYSNPVSGAVIVSLYVPLSLNASNKA